MSYRDEQLKNCLWDWNRENYPIIAIQEQAALMSICSIFPQYLNFNNINTVDNLFNQILKPLESERDTYETILGIKEYTFLQALIYSRKLYADNIISTVSKVTKYSTNKGLFELEASGDIEKTLGTKTTPVTPLFSCERNSKGTKENTIRIISEDTSLDSVAAKNEENLLRSNVKKIIENNTYNYLVMHNTCESPYGFPLYQTDLSYTIASTFRKFDSALKNFLDCVGSDTSDIEKRRKRTKQLYKKHFALSGNVFKEISDIHTPKLVHNIALDRVIYNYEMERLYHFTLLPLLIYYRKEWINRVTDITKLDELLISFSNLPNAFFRNMMVDKVFSKDKLTPKKETKLINLLAYYYCPIISKAFFHTVYNDSLNGSLNINDLLNKMVSHLKANIILSKSGKNSILSELEYNYLRYIFKTTHQYRTDYISPDNMTNNDLDFIYKFFRHNFTKRTYRLRNSVILNYDYFGFSQPYSWFKAYDEIEDHIQKIREKSRDIFSKHGLPFSTS